MTAPFRLVNHLHAIHLNGTGVFRSSGPLCHPNLKEKEEEKKAVETYSRNRQGQILICNK